MSLDVGGLDAHGVEDEVDYCKSEDGHYKTDDGVKNSVFGVSDLFAVAAGKDIFDAAYNEHND